MTERTPDYERGYRAGMKAAIDHVQQYGMQINHQPAKDAVNVLAFELGNCLGHHRRGNPLPDKQAP